MRHDLDKDGFSGGHFVWWDREIAVDYSIPWRGTLAGPFHYKQKMLVLGMVNIGFGAVGLLSLAYRLLLPMEVFIGVPVITSLPEIAIRTGTATSKVSGDT